VAGVLLPRGGQSLSYAREDSLTVETTALAVLATLKSGQFTNSVNQGLAYLIKSKGPSGAWGSTQATVLALKALVAGAGGPKQQGKATFTVAVNGKEAAEGQVTEDSADVLRQFDLKDHVRTGPNEATVGVKGETGLLYQVAGWHFEPYRAGPQQRPVLEAVMDYDRPSPSTKDVLRAKAAVKYDGRGPTPAASGWGARGGPCGSWSSRPARSPPGWRPPARRPTASARWSPTPPRWPAGPTCCRSTPPAGRRRPARRATASWWWPAGCAV
jgi:hypothetical protein